MRKMFKKILKSNKPSKSVPDASDEVGDTGIPDSSHRRSMLQSVARLFQKPRGMVLGFFVLGLGLVMVEGIIIARQLRENQRVGGIYEKVLKEVAVADSLEQKEELLSAYARSDCPEALMRDAKNRIKMIREQIISRDYSWIDHTAMDFKKKGDFKEAMAAYDRFQEKYPKNQYRAAILTRKKELSGLIETSDFEKVEVAVNEQAEDRIETLKAFLAKYPDGLHKEAALTLIADMEDDHFIYTDRKIQEGEKDGNWQRCLELSQKYIDTYPDSEHTQTLKVYQVVCHAEMTAARAFSKLQNEKMDFGTDYENAVMVYSDFIQTYPETRVRGKAEQEISRLKKLAETERLNTAKADVKARLANTEETPRFVAQSDESILDTETGLMWCLLDSRRMLNKCLNYDDAVSYVAALETAGYRDWRLPTPEELTALHTGKLFFPSDSGQWYWSSKFQKHYKGEWIVKVDVTMAMPDQIVKQEKRDAWQCGAVRAVRKARHKKSTPQATDAGKTGV